MEKELSRVRMWCFILLAVIGVLLFLFVREYMHQDELPVTRMPLIAVAIGFFLYYCGRYSKLRRK